MEEQIKKTWQGFKKQPYGIDLHSNTGYPELGKLPPQAVDIEEAVLGALMLEQDALTKVIDIFKPEIFYKDAHRIIFKAINTLFRKSEPVDILTVTNELKNSGELDLVGGSYYISQLTSRVGSAANIEYHSRILHQKYIQRELIRISTGIIKDAYEDSMDVLDMLDMAESELYKVSDNNFRRDYNSMEELIKEAISEIEKAREHKGSVRGVPTGFTELDRITAGWQKSDFVVIAARPGMGKTAFVLSMARNVAVDFKKPVAVFSLEMSAIQLVTRLISAESLLPADKLKKGNLENYEWEQLNAKITDLVEAKLFIDDTPALSMFELRSKCRRLHAQHGIELVIVDYIQLMRPSQDTRGNREQEISSISRSLKALAKELNIPVIALSQLNRSVETRSTGAKRPQLSDLRESGAIEQDADMVIFIYRPEYYKIEQDEDGNPTKGIAEIIIAKHRSGPIDDVKLKFIDKYARFTNLEEDYEIGGTMNPNTQFEGTMNRTIQSKMNDDEEEIPF